MSQKDIYQESLELHQKLGGKMEIRSRVPLKTQKDLSLSYTPGVASVCLDIAKNPDNAYIQTIKKNTVAIVTDGSAVLGLGNIGALASIPVMEGKSILFKKYANIDAYPICLRTQDTDEIINIVRNISPVFAGINLEDISAPRCFEIEERLQQIGIPVFHDDQHGTAIVVLAALLNAIGLAEKRMSDLKVVINGAGAAGTAIANLLQSQNTFDEKLESVKDVIVCDTRGIICQSREDIKTNPAKVRLSLNTNKNNISGSLNDALHNADVFVGVSVANLLTPEMILTMNKKPLVFALANPVPEIMPDEAKKAGVFIIATGRSDFPNQINNVLAFPGIFRGAIDSRSARITGKMKVAAARALAEFTNPVSTEKILPSPLEDGIGQAVAKAVFDVAKVGN